MEDECSKMTFFFTFPEYRRCLLKGCQQFAYLQLDILEAEYITQFMESIARWKIRFLLLGFIFNGGENSRFDVLKPSQGSLKTNHWVSTSTREIQYAIDVQLVSQTLTKNQTSKSLQTDFLPSPYQRERGYMKIS